MQPYHERSCFGFTPRKQTQTVYINIPIFPRCYSDQTKCAENATLLTIILLCVGLMAGTLWFPGSPQGITGTSPLTSAGIDAVLQVTTLVSYKSCVCLTLQELQFSTVCLKKPTTQKPQQQQKTLKDIKSNPNVGLICWQITLPNRHEKAFNLRLKLSIFRY